MGVTFTIGGVGFSALTDSAGRYALSPAVTSAAFDEQRFHVKGANGTYLVTGGRLGRRFSLRVRYVGTLSNVYSMFASDKTTWEGSTFAISTPEGNFSRCRLAPYGARIVRDPVAIGRNNLVFMDVAVEAVSDA
jgi:hypothetical protein